MTSSSGSAVEIPLQPQQNATFNSPWEAQVFALAVRLQETGILTKDSWTRALASEIQQASLDSVTRTSTDQLLFGR